MEELCNMQRIHTEDVDYSPVLGLSHAGRQIGGATCAHEGVQSSTSHTIVPDTQSWHQLDSTECLQSQGAIGPEGMTPMTMAIASNHSEAENEHHKVNNQLLGQGWAIMTLGATALDDLHSSDEVISICPRDWGMPRAAGSEYGRHHFRLTRGEYRPKRWTWQAGSSGGRCHRTSALRGLLSDCSLMTETQREWLDRGTRLICAWTVNDRAFWTFPSIACIISRFVCY